MYKLKYLSVPLLCLMAACASFPTFADEAPVSLTWADEGVSAGGTGFENVFVIKNISSHDIEGNWSLFFSQLPRGRVTMQSNDVKIEAVNANFYQLSPTSDMKPLSPQDSIVVRYSVSNSTPNISQTPEGCYWVANVSDKNAQPTPVELTVVTPTQEERQTTSARRIYNANLPLEGPISIADTDILPSVKHVVSELDKSMKIPGEVSLIFDDGLSNEAALLTEKLEQIYNIKVEKDAPFHIFLKLSAGDAVENDEQYNLNIEKKRITISGVTPHGVFDGTQTLLSLLKNNSLRKLACQTITDYPDLEYRGWMCDISRNFTPVDKLKKMLDVLSSYKINKLHLHFADDEGWRLEIPGLEELTTVGSRRGHTLDEADCLYPGYDGGFDPNAPSSGNGYYSKAEFIDLLKYAACRHIQIIPEIETPGHARAAIVSMKARYNKYVGKDKAKAEEYLLTDPDDASEYISAQEYTDNVMNVALPSCFRFIEKVVGEIREMYHEAGLELSMIHIGGDEVANGAWLGSPVCQNFMKEHNLTTAHELKEYFYCQIADFMTKENIKIGGWQEMALQNSPQTDAKLKEITSAIYCWNTVPEWEDDEIPYKIANNGYPIVLCNANCLYLDLAYNDNYFERGHCWGGYVDESKGFSVLPFSIYRSSRTDLTGNPVDIDSVARGKVPLIEKQNIKGLQAQLFAETIRGYRWVEYYVFPKILGLVERAWNAHPVWENGSGETEQKLYYKDLSRFYNVLAQKELPYFKALDITFRLPNPGLIVKDGYLYANCAYPNVEIRYTTDGSEPNEKSALWTNPVECQAKYIKAKAFYLGRESVTTLYVNQ